MWTPSLGTDRSSSRIFRLRHSGELLTLHLEHYRDIFDVQFKGSTIQALGSQFMQHQFGFGCAKLDRLPFFWPQCIDVKIPIFLLFYEVDGPFWFRYAWML